MTAPLAFALHGGATPKRDADHTAQHAHMIAVATAAVTALRDGAPALDVVVDAVRALEAEGLYIAGKGSAPNRAGVYELDAAVMDGAARRAGAVAGLIGVESPVHAARAVMEDTPHVMLAGEGAAAFAKERGLPLISDPEQYYQPAALPAHGEELLGHGTVGAVARDVVGHLAAATSTGGVLNKLPGRVGDTPLIGAGTWADERVAVSCTGQGEFFIRAAAAVDVSARVAYAGQSLDAAAAGALADMRRQGGEGGMIAIAADGPPALPYDSAGMKRAWLDDEGVVRAATYHA